MNDKNEDIHVVFYHFETNGLDSPIRPIQIGAIDSYPNSEREAYNQFIVPDRDIHPKATERNGFTKKNNKLYCSHGQAVNALDLNMGLIHFAEWLRSFKGKIILVSHNNMNFEARILLQNFKEFNIPHDFIYGFCDSLFVDRRIFPGRDEPRRLPDMMYKVNMRPKESFDALEKAQQCRSVVRRLAAQRKRKFMDFVTDGRWFKTLEQQNIWMSQSPAERRQQRRQKQKQQQNGHQSSEKPTAHYKSVFTPAAQALRAAPSFVRV